MRIVSTRSDPANASKPVSFRQALFSGLAPDGGLYVPEEQPDLRTRIGGFSKQESFRELSEALAVQLLEGELNREAVKRVVGRAFNFEPALRCLEKDQILLELFHLLSKFPLNLTYYCMINISP